MSPLRLFLLVTLLVGSAARAGERPSWQVAIVLDQSGSMRGNDAADNALVGTSILADLMGPGDRLAVHPQYGTGLFSGGSAVVLDTTRREELRTALLGLRSSAIDSNFEPAFDQARADLDQRRAHFDRQLLLHVYDGGEPARSPIAFQDALVDLAGAGVQRYLIGVGGQADDRHVFADYGEDHRALVTNSAQLLDAYAVVLARLLNARSVPRGQGPPTFTVDLPAGAAEAWLVALADAPVRSVTATAGHPPARRVAPVDGAGWTLTTRSGVRSYQVLHLDAPSPGPWTFEVDTSVTTIEYLLLPWFDVGLEVGFTNQPPAGTPAEAEVRTTGAGEPEDFEVVALTGGQEIRLRRDDDGVWRGDVPAGRPGKQEVVFVGRSKAMEVRKSANLDVAEASGAFDCSKLDRQVLAVGSQLDVTLTTVGQAAPIESAWAVFEGAKLPLRDDGATPDAAAGDDVWTVRLTPARTGVADVVFWNRIAGTERSCTARLDVRDVVQIVARAPADVDVGPCGGPHPADDPAGEDCAASGCCTGASLPLDLSGTQASGPYIAEIELTTAPPRGIELHLASAPFPEGRLVVGRPVRVPLHPTASELPLRVCLRSCPASGRFSPLTQLRVRVPGAFTPDAQGGLVLDGPGITVDVSATVAPSSFWKCWGWWVIAAALATVVALAIWGIVRPVRFSRPGSGGRIPSTVAVFPVLQDRRGRTLPPQEPLTWIGLRERSRRTFWRHERACFSAKFLEPEPWRDGARATLELRRGPAGPEARLFVHGGSASAHHFQPGLPIDAYGSDWRPVPDDGLVVGSEVIVFFEDDQRCVLFGHRGG